MQVILVRDIAGEPMLPLVISSIVPRTSKPSLISHDKPALEAPRGLRSMRARGCREDDA